MDIDFILQVSREVGFGGGSECVAFELHRAWLAQGIDARIVTSHATEPEAREGAHLAGVWLNTWVMNSRLKHIATAIAVPLFTLIATLHVRRFRNNKLVVSHGDSLVGDVCVVHSVNQACLAEKRRGGYYGWILNPTNLWVALRDSLMFGGRRYRRLVAISERVRTELKDYYNVPDSDIVTIPNGINLSRFKPGHADSRTQVRRSFGIPDDAPLVLFVGSRFRIKGLKFAIQALAKMDFRAYLLVVGNDTVKPFKQLAEELGIAEQVIFAGARNDLPTVYPAADAFLLPTMYETFALVCLEAMASGLPVFACPVGGIEDYLRDGENGFHIDRDPVAMASKLDRFLADRELQKRIREAGLATAQDYSWEKIAGQYLALFAEIAKEKSAEEALALGCSKWESEKNPQVSVEG